MTAWATRMPFLSSRGCDLRVVILCVLACLLAGPALALEPELPERRAELARAGSAWMPGARTHALDGSLVGAPQVVASGPGFAIAWIESDAGIQSLRLATADATGRILRSVIVAQADEGEQRIGAFSLAQAEHATAIAWIGTSADAATSARFALYDRYGASLGERAVGSAAASSRLGLAWHEPTLEWALAWDAPMETGSRPGFASLGAHGEWARGPLDAAARGRVIDIEAHAEGYSLALERGQEMVVLSLESSGRARSLSAGDPRDAGALRFSSSAEALGLLLGAAGAPELVALPRSFDDGDADLATTWALADSSAGTRVAWIEPGEDAGRLMTAFASTSDDALLPSGSLPARKGRHHLALAAGAKGDLLVWNEGESTLLALLLPRPTPQDDDPDEEAPAESPDAPGDAPGKIDPAAPSGGGGFIDACGFDRWVDPNGDDSGNDCSDELNPCQTVSHAIAEACVGETVFMQEGQYNEDIVIDKPLTVDAVGIGVFTTLNGTGTGDVVTILSSGVRWDGTEVRGAPGHACIRVGSDTVTDLEDINIANSAFFECGVGVIFENTGYDPLRPWNRVLSCDMRDNEGDGSGNFGNGIILRGGNGKIEIKTSFIRNNDGTGLRVEPPTGGRENRLVIISGNRIEGNGSGVGADGTHGMELHEITELRLEGNRVRQHDGVDGSDDARAMWLDDVGAGATFNCNNLVDNDTGLVLTGTTSEIPVRQSRFENHLFTGLRTESGAGGATTVTESLFAGNTSAVDHSGDGTLDVTHSWWGAADGPTNLGGTGNGYSGSVDASGFIARAVAPRLARRPLDSGWSISFAACYDRIQPAIDAALADDLIILGPGLYRERLSIDKRIEIEGVDGGAECSPTEINGIQSGGSHLPAMTITNADGMTLRQMTVRNAGEGTVCGQNTGDEIGIDVLDTSDATFEDLCLLENGVTEMRLRGDSDNNTLRDITIDGIIRDPPPDFTDTCGHRSREGILIDGWPACEGGNDDIASGNVIENLVASGVSRGVSLRFADGTEVLSSTITASNAPAWDGGNYSVGVLVSLSDNVRLEANRIGQSGQTEGVRIAGRDAASCVTSRTDTSGTTLDGNIIEDVAGAGLRLFQASGDPGAPVSTLARCNDILFNSVGADVDWASFGATANVLTLNDIRNNSVGVRNNSVATLSSKESWWGSPSGPGGAGGGTGDTIVGAVSFAPVLASPARTDGDGDGQSECDGDCDDTDGNNFEGNPETCDGFDNDCDDLVDEELPLFTYYLDSDGDGFGDVASTIEVCDPTAPSGYVTDSSDCNDGDEFTYPGAPEVLCDGVDQGCDGTGNDSEDLDLDSFDVCALSDPGDTDGLPVDCDDTDPLRNPDAFEAPCDGIDNDCDGTIDRPGVTCSDLAVSQLVFESGSKSGIAWNPATQADAYALYRGEISSAGFEEYNHRCQATELGATRGEDGDTPPAGEAFYYLSTALVFSGDDVDGGSVGQDSQGIERPEFVGQECGARVFVDPDVVGSSGGGLSWADAFTTLARALQSPRGSNRALEVWARGTVLEDGLTLSPATGPRGLRFIGGFAGTESSSWERDPGVNTTTWRSPGSGTLMTLDGASLVIVDATLEGGARAVTGTLGAGATLGFDNVSASGFSERVIDVVLGEFGGAELTISDSSFDGSGQGAIRAVSEVGALGGYVRDSAFAGNSDAALRLEARPALGASSVDVDVARISVSGGATGIVLGAHSDDAGFDATQSSTLSASLVRGTSGTGVLVESSGSFSSFAGSANATAAPLIIANTISDAGGAGLLCSATRTDSTGDPSLHGVFAEPRIVDSLVTFHAGSSVEESADDPLTNLVADPILLRSGLFGSTSLYLDEGATTLTLIGDVNALAGNVANWDEDPLYVDRVGGDFRLQTGSPAIDRADALEPGAPPRDLDGKVRPIGEAPDTGAYEHEPLP